MTAILTKPRRVADMDSKVLLAQPVFDHVLSVFFGTLLVVGGIFCWATQYSKQETVSGEIAAVSGFSAIVADQGAIVSQLRVASGTRVHKGQVLAVLSLPPVISGDGDTIAQSIQRMRESIANIDNQLAEYARTSEEARQQIAEVEASAQASLVSARNRGSATKARQQMAERRLRGYEQLAGKGFITDMAVDQARGVVMQLNQEASDTELTLQEVRRSRADRVTGIQNRIAEIRQAMLNLSTQRLQTENQLHAQTSLQTREIVAPADGVVSAVSVRPGERIEAGARILAIGQPSARLTAILTVPSKAIGMIDVGQRVVLKYDAFPYQSFGVRYGKVVRVEQASIDTGAQKADDAKQIERNFIVEVAPAEDAVEVYGRRRALKVGMTLTADIEVERRNLLQWFLEPLVALRGRMG
ncbi:HlyD family efflux transporter periplasmic adaptor subunit [Sphingomonas sp. KR3-1]|uniref:HlyD family secretion protein n=1 Tax=Sphingomonas sp. KR3-1 TaxID=3156611 RepID=UPI0032B46AA7